MKMVSWMNFKEELKDRVDHIEAILKEYLPKEEGWQKTVIAAMNYSVLAGGKRLRPMLMEETYMLQLISPLQVLQKKNQLLRFFR